MDMRGQFLRVPWNFFVIGLGKENEIEEITLWPEIWWHDTLYHEADHCMKWPYSANVCIFDLGWPRVSSMLMVNLEITLCILAYDQE